MCASDIDDAVTCEHDIGANKGPLLICILNELEIPVRQHDGLRFDFTEVAILFFYQEPIFHIVAWKAKSTCFLVVDLHGISCQKRLALIGIL